MTDKFQAISQTPFRVLHGMSKTKTYAAWHDMLQRCRNPKHSAYVNYGGRGITVCERWRQFPNFLADMGECPPALTLDRFPDNNGHYEPANCRWSTRQDQARNRRARRRKNASPSLPAISPAAPSMLQCPFCKEDDFDAIGLKHHLLIHCDEFSKVRPL